MFGFLKHKKEKEIPEFVAFENDAVRIVGTEIVKAQTEIPWVKLHFRVENKTAVKLYVRSENEKIGGYGEELDNGFAHLDDMDISHLIVTSDAFQKVTDKISFSGWHVGFGINDMRYITIEFDLTINNDENAAHVKFDITQVVPGSFVYGGEFS